MRSGVGLTAASKNIRTPVNSDRKVETLKLADLRSAKSDRDLIVWIDLSVKGQPKSTNLVTFARPKHLELADSPGISAKVGAAVNGSVQGGAQVEASRAMGVAGVGRRRRADTLTTSSISARADPSRLRFSRRAT
jgi:hypothetical protein